MTTNGDNQDVRAERLWEHSVPQSTPMYDFMQQTNKKHNVNFESYSDMYNWSIDDISAFWEDCWHYLGVKASQPYTKVISDTHRMFPRPTFFEGARLNFAENLLYPANAPDLDADSPALLAATEATRETVTWRQLRARVSQCHRVLKLAGISEHDRVAGYVGNHANAVVGMLATTSLGAIWTAISPDSGVSMVLDRLQQIEPKVLLADDGQVYNGKQFSVLSKVSEILEQLPTVKSCYVFNVTGGDIGDVKASGEAKVVAYDEAVANAEEGAAKELAFAQLPADHPVYILYSSGTTGAPKCIVHGAIGTLLQHKKEHILHCSIAPGSRLFYFTTCTWMMWHWLISGLASGATLILYDGSPMRYCSSPAIAESSTTTTAAPTATTSPPNSEVDDCAMARLIDELQIEHSGTSAKYLSILEQKNVLPREKGCRLDTLKAVYNTASPLAPSTFRYVYKAFGPDLLLGSITGGTDIISLFGAANPLVPVYAGEVQAAGLGMAIRSYDSESGKDVTGSDEPGDLVCTRPFICQPVAFWGKTGEEKYRKSYFERFDGVWHHGDFVQFIPHPDSAGKTYHGILMLGRSDGVLNPAGVRFGSAEIYNILLKHFGGVISDSLCVGRIRKDRGETDETVCLFCKLEDGAEWSEELARSIKGRIRGELSARHVPGVVEECPDVPVTINGKKVEGAVKSIISGSKVKSGASVANAEVLDWFTEWAEKH